MDYEHVLNRKIFVKPQKSWRGLTSVLVISRAEAAFRQGFLAHSIDIGPWKGNMPVEQHRYLNISRVDFSISIELRQQAEITFCLLEQEIRVPGVIDFILSIEVGRVEVFILGMRQRKCLNNTTQVPNPFSCFSNFGAELWSKDIEKKQIFITLTKPIYYIQSAP